MIIKQPFQRPATNRGAWILAGSSGLRGYGAKSAPSGKEGSGFYGIPLAEGLPYAVTRTWHTQLAVFWIATAWLATGLFIAPAVSGYEPKFQRAGVNFLFVCLLLIVVGSMFGTWYGTRQRMEYEMNFWFGHQGYEYVDLGRFWQIFLFVGLWVWLLLMGRAMWPAIRRPREHRHLLALFLIASTAIALFYGAGLMWGRQTHYALAEYWRWWVVHLWVEGFFEVFATVVIAFLFTRMGLLRTVTATATWWIPMLLILALWRHVYKKFPLTYDPGYWGAVFPLGMYTVCTFEMARAMELDFLLPVPRVFVYVALAAWSLAFLGLVRRLLALARPSTLRSA